jgi:hypothetical protein
MIVQLNPTIPVFTPRGPGHCVAWIDYSQDHNTLWKVMLDDGGEVWDFPQSDIRGVENFSLGRGRAVFPSPEREKIYDR